MQGLNLTTFYAYIRKAPFGGRLTQSQIEGIEQVLEQFEGTGLRAYKYLAYILATAFHETGGKMQPVREGFAKTDAAARKIVAKRAYSVVDKETGQVYYGRGLVQLTWSENYKKMEDVVRRPLYKNPDLALDPAISAAILVNGMINGSFTGKKLADYFNGENEDPVGARRIINGTDKAQLIAQYYKNFLDALNHAADGGQPEDVKQEDGQPDTPSLVTDKTTMGAISAVAGSGAVGALTSINSPWAFAAFLVLALGAYLFLTGRLQIVRKAGA